MIDITNMSEVDRRSLHHLTEKRKLDRSYIIVGGDLPFGMDAFHEGTNRYLAWRRGQRGPLSVEEPADNVAREISINGNVLDWQVDYGYYQMRNGRYLTPEEVKASKQADKCVKTPARTVSSKTAAIKTVPAKTVPAKTAPARPAAAKNIVSKAASKVASKGVPRAASKTVSRPASKAPRTAAESPVAPEPQPAAVECEISKDFDEVLEAFQNGRGDSWFDPTASCEAKRRKRARVAVKDDESIVPPAVSSVPSTSPPFVSPPVVPPICCVHPACSVSNSVSSFANEDLSPPSRSVSVDVKSGAPGSSPSPNTTEAPLGSSLQPAPVPSLPTLPSPPSSPSPLYMPSLPSSPPPVPSQQPQQQPGLQRAPSAPSCKFPAFNPFALPTRQPNLVTFSTPQSIFRTPPQPKSHVEPQRQPPVALKSILKKVHKVSPPSPSTPVMAHFSPIRRSPPEVLPAPASAPAPVRVPVAPRKPLPSPKQAPARQQAPQLAPQQQVLSPTQPEYPREGPAGPIHHGHISGESGGFLPLPQVQQSLRPPPQCFRTRVPQNAALRAGSRVTVNQGTYIGCKGVIQEVGKAGRFTLTGQWNVRLQVRGNKVKVMLPESFLSTC